MSQATCFFRKEVQFSCEEWDVLVKRPSSSAAPIAALEAVAAESQHDGFDALIAQPYRTLLPSCRRSR